mmetsp:Transcript_20110/g.48803  ORF Transcript_20110/g.48803 Transcript_20110/m.48803 type:complete len:242 (-) Transcript_20110:940-1665(-)
MCGRSSTSCRSSSSSSRRRRAARQGRGEEGISPVPVHSNGRVGLRRRFRLGESVGVGGGALVGVCVGPRDLLVMSRELGGRRQTRDGQEGRRHRLACRQHLPNLAEQLLGGGMAVQEQAQQLTHQVESLHAHARQLVLQLHEDRLALDRPLPAPCQRRLGARLDPIPTHRPQIWHHRRGRGHRTRGTHTSTSGRRGPRRHALSWGGILVGGQCLADQDAWWGRGGRHVTVDARGVVELQNG